MRITRIFFGVIILLALCVFGLLQKAGASELLDEAAYVRAVLFYSPTCGHCHKVITEDLPPLMEKYGEQLQIIGINVTTPEGKELFHTFLTEWKIPEEDYVVPILVVADTVLVGGREIPQLFPGIVENGLQTGSIDWPEISGLPEIIAQAQAQAEATPTETVVLAEGLSEEETTTPESVESGGNPTEELFLQTQEQVMQNEDSTSINASTDLSIPFDTEITVTDRFKSDLAANSVAVVVLAGMVISVIWVLVSVLQSSPQERADWSWVIPVLSIAGIFVAGYLSFIEVTQTEAVCGPFGDCNSVQESPYARVFGILPVGILGLVGYIAILLGWLLKRYGPDTWQKNLSLVIWGMALFGVIFSIYLTYLEPFVIGATCMWCISSAIIITTQFWAATEPVRQIWKDFEEDYEDPNDWDLDA